GQGEAAAAIRALLAGGALCEPGAARRLQDPLSLRCIAPVHGALRAAIAFAEPALAAELNGDSSNPVVLPEEGALGGGTILSTANFHTPLVAIAFDALSQACAQVAHLALARASKLLSAPLSDLPATLSPRGTTRSGFAPALKPVEALVAEIEHLALPVRGGTSVSADGVEDHMTHAPLAVHKLAQIVQRLRLVLAVELMIAAQAVDLRGPVRLGFATAAIHAAVRRVVPPLDDDRPLSADIMHLEATLLADGALLRTIDAALGA
ncbi:MAG: histidine ammonia-lyase, partial [Alphaproteobacteria bacterium]